MSLFKRIFGICETKLPKDMECWKYSDGKVELELVRLSELSTPGGAIRLEGKELPEKVLLIHGSDGNFYAFQNKCTHAGRRIDPLADSANIRCCSISKMTFDYEGKAVSGPVKKSLKTFQVKNEDGKLIILLD